jgi:hypothetical protein
MLDTRLALEGTTIDTATPIRQANNDAVNQAAATQRTLGQYYQNLEDREKSRLTSTIAGAAQLKTHLEANDMEGAKNFLLQRKQVLAQRQAAGEPVDTSDTDAALELLQSGRVDELMTNVNGLIAAGQVYGVFDQPDVGGSTGVLIDRLRQENPNLSVEEALGMIKGGAGQEAKNQANINSGREANFETQTGANQSDLLYKPQIAADQRTAVMEAERAQLQPKAIATLESALASKQAVIQKIDQAIPKVGSFTAGFFGQGIKFIPGTPAADLKADLDTILANAGFDKLQDMRNSSPTGGALGQVSERELALLQATWSNLQQAQSPEQLQQRLVEFRQQVQESWARVQRAYELDYGTANGQNLQMQPQIPSQKIRVTNGQETFEIDASDLSAAQADGFNQVGQ